MTIKSIARLDGSKIKTDTWKMYSC